MINGAGAARIINALSAEKVALRPPGAREKFRSRDTGPAENTSREATLSGRISNVISACSGANNPGDAAAGIYWDQRGNYVTSKFSS